MKIWNFRCKSGFSNFGVATQSNHYCSEEVYLEKNQQINLGDIIFTKDGIIFFEKKGNIIKFDYEKQIVWKINHYTKQEKKLSPLINFGNNDEVIIVTDNLSKYYAIDKSNGKDLYG